MRYLLTIPAACEQLSVGRSTLYKLANAGDIRFVKVGRKTLIPAESVRTYAERLTNQP